MREFRALEPVKERAKDVSKLLSEIIDIHRDIENKKEKIKEAKMYGLTSISRGGGWFNHLLKRLSKWCRISAFFTVSTTIIALAITIAYCFLLTKYLYSSMIIWRGLTLDHVGVQKFYDVMNAVGRALSEHLNIVWVQALMHPFILMIDFFASIEINLDAVEVTVRMNDTLTTKCLIYTYLCVCLF